MIIHQFRIARRVPRASTIAHARAAGAGRAAGRRAPAHRPSDRVNAMSDAI
jgi:hypothetical protein